MTNHVHLLITPAREKSIGKLMQSVGRRYVGYVNHTYRRTGTLWEGRYRATLVDSEGYLLSCMRYIDLNPVRAAMVRHPREYPWSSYLANGEGQPDPVVTCHALYEALGCDPDERRRAGAGVPLIDGRACSRRVAAEVKRPRGLALSPIGARRGAEAG
jgi:putative transposase